MDKTEVIEVEVLDQLPVETGKKKQKSIEVAREVLPLAQLLDTASMLAKSTVIPITYQNRPENIFIALDMSARMGVSPLMVMQNLYIIQGKPSFSGSAIGALLRSSPQFKNVEVNYVGTPNTDSWGAYVSAVKVSNKKEIVGGTVTIATAKKEGWYQKAGSKWQTMPEIMLAYRAYAWFGRVYAPELMMGLQSVEEVEDMLTQTTPTENLNPYEIVTE